MKTSYQSLQTAEVTPAAVQPWTPTARVARLPLPTLEGYDFVPVDAIVSARASGNYTYVTLADRTEKVVCKTLGQLEKELADRSEFFRIHRSHLVNLEYIRSYARRCGGRVTLEDEQCLPLSQARKTAFLEKLAVYFGCANGSFSG